jgi:DNA repair protein RecN (Recombination protein N)
MRMHDRLYGDEGSFSEELSNFGKTLEQLSTLDPELAERKKTVEEVYHSVVELGREMQAYADSHEHDPDRLEEVRERQDVLFRLMRKYGPTLQEVFEAESKLKDELEELGGSSLSKEEMDRKIAAQTEELEDVAAELSELRNRAAKTLSSEVGQALPGLGMPEGVFQVALTPLPETGPSGKEDVDFRVTVNPGFDPMPLSVIASGGEISRIMLALKATLAKVDRVPTLVFDEIDVGIGGAVAGKVADELLRVAEGHQVFVVTHLAQIAAGAHQHFYVEKDEGEGITAARVSRVEDDDRVSEIARMLSGNPKSANSRRHARELLGLPPALPGAEGEEDPPEAPDQEDEAAAASLLEDQVEEDEEEGQMSDLPDPEEEEPPLTPSTPPDPAEDS